MRTMASDQDEFLRATMGAMDLVFNLSRRLTDSRQDAEDLVQDTFLKAFRAWKDLRRPRGVEPWLATICLNLARSRFRTRARRPSEVPFALVDLSGLSTYEAAEAMGTPRGTVLSRLHRGRRTLARLLGDRIEGVIR